MEPQIDILLLGFFDNELYQLNDQLRQLGAKLHCYYVGDNAAADNLPPTWDLALVSEGWAEQYIAWKTIKVHQKGPVGPGFLVARSPEDISPEGWLAADLMGVLSPDELEKTLPFVEQSLDFRRPFWRRALPQGNQENFSKASTAVAIVNQGVLVYKDHNLCTILDYPPDALQLGIHFGETLGLPDHYCKMLAELPSEEISPEPLTIEFSVRSGGQRNLWIEAEITLVLWQGWTVRRLVLRDISARKQQELDRLQAKKQETVQRFTIGVIHNVSNLMQGILGFVELARRGLPMGLAAHQDLAQAERISHQLIDFTSTLRTLVRLQKMSPLPVNINKLLSEAGDDMARQLGKQVGLVLRLGDGLPKMQVDYEGMVLLLRSLCSHARTSMPNEGDLVVRTDRRVFAEGNLAYPWMRPGEYVAIQFTERGVSEESTNLENVFEPFSDSDELAGSGGLDLALAQSIARHHGGVIRADDSPGLGNVFEVLLPSSETYTPKQIGYPLLSKTNQGWSVVK